MSKSLTLGKLSEYDDLLTDHLIDKVYFWIRTHKADRHKSHSSRRVKTHEVVDILKRHIIAPKTKVSDAVQAFLRLNTARSFYRDLSKAEKSDFEKHLRKYLCIYYPEAGFEICSTDRYPGPKSESCVIANKNWKAGEVVKYLAGTIVAMTEEEEEYYEMGSDFSILHSSRLDSMCLFLGPARFVNHDCVPNGTFVTQGGSIAIALIRPVNIGEEITVFYSPDYFGPDNADCLCATCEKKGSGGYRSKAERVAASIRADQLDDQAGVSTVTGSRLGSEKKRNQVQTIEVSPEGVKKDLLAKTINQTITPPDSELSVDDLARGYVNLSDEDESFHSADEIQDNESGFYLSDSDDDHDFELADHHEEEAPKGDSKSEILASGAGTSLHLLKNDSGGGSTRENTGTEEPERKLLRPRRATRDYNLKKNSRASLHPAILEAEQRESKRLQRLERKDNVNYCKVCDEEVSPNAPVEEVWSISEHLGIKQSLCKRCERHFALYGKDWPQRAIGARAHATVRSKRWVVGSSSSLGHSRNTSDPNRPRLAAPTNLPRTSRLSLPGNLTQSSDSPDSRSVIEEAKALMKRGNIFVPRLSVGLQPARRRNFSLATILNPTPDASTTAHIKKELTRSDSVGPVERPHSTARSSAPPGSSQSVRAQSACFCCRKRKQKCSKVDSGAARCDRCIKFNRKCIGELDLTPAERDKAYIPLGAQTPSSRHMAPSISTEDRSLSPDSQVAACQVRSPRKIADQPSQRSFDIVDEQTGSSSGRRTSGRMSRPTLKRKASVLDNHVEADRESFHEPEQSQQGNSRKKTKGTKGSWFYVEVQSSDSEEEKPQILPGRTRRQQRISADSPSKESSRTLSQVPSVAGGNSDTSLTPLKTETKSEPDKRKSIRKPRRQTWEYIVIDSDEEEAKPVVMSGPRTTRRKSTPMYKV